MFATQVERYLGAVRLVFVVISEVVHVHLSIVEENINHNKDGEEKDVDHDHPVDPTSTKPLEVKEQLTQGMGQQVESLVVNYHLRGWKFKFYF